MRFLKYFVQSPDGLLFTPLDDAIASMTAAETVEDSAAVFINSVPGLITAAVAAATNNGATATQLAPLTQLAADLKTKSDALQAALVANTPAAPGA
jgi:hypothetical protein